jgi:hypothetical protein
LGEVISLRIVRDQSKSAPATVYAVELTKSLDSGAGEFRYRGEFPAQRDGEDGGIAPVGAFTIFDESGALGRHEAALTYLMLLQDRLNGRTLTIWRPTPPLLKFDDAGWISVNQEKNGCVEAEIEALTLELLGAKSGSLQLQTISEGGKVLAEQSAFTRAVAFETMLVPRTTAISDEERNVLKTQWEQESREAGKDKVELSATPSGTPLVAWSNELSDRKRLSLDLRAWIGDPLSIDDTPPTPRNRIGNREYQFRFCVFGEDAAGKRFVRSYLSTVTVSVEQASWGRFVRVLGYWLFQTGPGLITLLTTVTALSLLIWWLRGMWQRREQAVSRMISEADSSPEKLSKPTSEDMDSPEVDQSQSMDRSQSDSSGGQPGDDTI